MRKIATLVALVVMIGLSTHARENTTRQNLQLAAVDTVDVAVDSLALADPLEFQEKAISVRGYSKRVSDSKESFMLTNNTNMRISSVEVRFLYTDVKGIMIHERVEVIDCDLPPYSSKQIAIKSFDEGKRFYYYMSKAKKKDAIPYKVAATTISYDIKIVRNE